jgi:hypothetical protein
MAANPHDVKIETNLDIAAELSQGDISGKQHPIKDQIAAAEYLKANEFAEEDTNSAGMGIRTLRSPGYSK